ncbi:4-(cytidine 5'-diphospho)-2-C-methyl-D-erythritol kinase [bacterium]|nr:4-(cytidine 5'-diphospho)-2-C-methyl-D-erythritol kinase [bacterium]
MNKITIQCPAKINLNLKIICKRTDGFHNIESIMQTINLFDYLTIKVEYAPSNQIILSGNSNEIPYNEKNLVYKAVELFLKEAKITNKKIEIYIEKNIPVSAGLGGGSTDGAGALYGLNKIFNSKIDLHSLCAKLGSDLNVCLQGGRILATGRGEILAPQKFEKFDVSLIKPLNLGISAKEAYEKYSLHGHNEKYKNDLEYAVIGDYKELQYIKQKYPNSVMTGSGSTYFIINREFKKEKNYWVKNGLKSIDYGVKEI